jgi:fused signal recognition particle receptor
LIRSVLPLFESLKKKFSGAIDKISDKISEEEVATSPEKQTSEEKGTTTSKKTETPIAVDEKTELKIPKTSDNLETIAKKSDKNLEESSEAVPESKKSSRFSIFRRKSEDEKSEEDLGTLEDERKEKTDSKSSEEAAPEDNTGFLSFATHKTISDKDIDNILFELELALLEGDVALEVAEQIVNSVKEDLVGRKIRRRNDVAEFTREALKKAISEILVVEGPDIKSMVQNARKTGEPLKIMFVGVNGTGKTTTIGKIADHYVKEGYTPVIAASDTFRAGAIEQISHHAEKVGVKIIRHQKGADPAAVAYDAVEHARAQKKELVLIDTAGRMQTNVNLMDEMKKIQRVVKPELVIFVGDALTGNDAVEQARKFDEAVGVDGIILTKADADAKGGSALSIGHVINKSIMFLGIGQSYGDLIEFKPDWMVEQVLGD